MNYSFRLYGQVAFLVMFILLSFVQLNGGKQNKDEVTVVENPLFENPCVKNQLFELINEAYVLMDEIIESEDLEKIPGFLDDYKSLFKYEGTKLINRQSSKTGKTFLHVACQKLDVGLAKRLMEMGSKMHQKDLEGKSPYGQAMSIYALSERASFEQNALDMRTFLERFDPQGTLKAGFKKDNRLSSIKERPLSSGKKKKSFSAQNLLHLL